MFVGKIIRDHNIQRHDAEDIVQDALIRTVRYINSGRYSPRYFKMLMSSHVDWGLSTYREYKLLSPSYVEDVLDKIPAACITEDEDGPDEDALLDHIVDAGVISNDNARILILSYVNNYRLSDLCSEFGLKDHGSIGERRTRIKAKLRSVLKHGTLKLKEQYA